MKPKNLKLIALARLIATILYFPFLFIGYVFYLLSKLIRAIGYLLMWKPYSAKKQIKGFWSIQSSIGDCF